MGSTANPTRSWIAKLSLMIDTLNFRENTEENTSFTQSSIFYLQHAALRASTYPSLKGRLLYWANDQSHGIAVIDMHHRLDPNQ